MNVWPCTIHASHLYLTMETHGGVKLRLVTFRHGFTDVSCYTCIMWYLPVLIVSVCGVGVCVCVWTIPDKQIWKNMEPGQGFQLRTFALVCLLESVRAERFRVHDGSHYWQNLVCKPFCPSQLLSKIKGAARQCYGDGDRSRSLWTDL